MPGPNQQLDRINQQINWLKNKYACLLTQNCNPCNDSGNNDGFSQDNTFKVILTNTVTSNSINPISDVTTAINQTPQFQKSEIEQIFFKVPRVMPSGNSQYIFFEYYKFLNKGKGNYGLGSGNTINSIDLQFESSTQVIELPSSNQLPSIVYRINSNDYENPDIAVDNSPFSYPKDGTRDYYFQIFELNGATEAVPRYKLYKISGPDGTYGNTSGGGYDSSPSDYILFDTELHDSNRNYGIKEKILVVESNIDSFLVANDDISKAVNRSFRGIVYIGELEIVKFAVIRVERKLDSNGDYKVNFIYEKYHWKRGNAIINGDSTLDDFDIEYSIPITPMWIPSKRSGQPQVIALLNDDITAPEEPFLTSSTPITTTSNEKTYVIVFNYNKVDNQFKVYEFTGANDTYGNGEGGVATNADFDEITLVDLAQSNQIENTSQLFNDGDDGVNRFMKINETVDLSTNQTVGGKKTFSIVPASSQDASAGTDLVRKSQMDTALNSKANDADVVKLTGNQTISSGIKTFVISPIVPTATTATQAVNKGQLDLKADDNTVVKLTGTQIVAGAKTFSTVPKSSQDASASTDLVRKSQHDLKANDNAVVKLTGNQSIAGVKTFSVAPKSSVNAVASDELVRLGQVASIASTGIIPLTIFSLNQCYVMPNETLTRWIYNGASGGEFCFLPDITDEGKEIIFTNVTSNSVAISVSSAEVFNVINTGMEPSVTTIPAKGWIRIRVLVHNGTAYFLIVEKGLIS